MALTLRDIDNKTLNAVKKATGETTAAKALTTAAKNYPGNLKKIQELQEKIKQLENTIDDIQEEKRVTKDSINHLLQLANT